MDVAKMSFIPALQHDILTPAYDVLIRLTIPELRFKTHLIRSAAIAAGHRVLDVGCGTGTLLLLASKCHRDATFIGIDPDLRIVRRARRKVPAATFELASAAALPFDADSFDRVLSTLTFHHLTREEKLVTMREIFRVLRPNGQFHLGDFGKPDSFAMRVASFLTEKIGREHVEENFAGMLPSMLAAAGFTKVEETGRFTTIFGVLRITRAAKGIPVLPGCS
jgi:SAM-dependent methyltransferase